MSGRSALDPLGVPQRRRVAPPADDDRVRAPSTLRTWSVQRGRVVLVALVDRREAVREGDQRSARGARWRGRRRSRRRRARRDGLGGRGRRVGRGRVGRRRRAVDGGPRASIAARGQDRQPGPGHQRRTEVVAADVRVDVRRGEEAGDRRGRPGQQRVARAAHRGHDERDRDERAPGSRTGRTSARPSSPNLRGRSPNGSDRLPWNCSARTMYRKPSQVFGVP